MIDAEIIEEKTVEKEKIKREGTSGCKYANLDPLKVDTEEKAKIICSLLNENKSSSVVKNTCTKENYEKEENS